MRLFCFIFVASLALTGCQSSATQTRRRAIEKKAVDPGEEALARRKWAVDLLRAEGVPILATLPVIESSTEAKLRQQDEVVRRAIALAVVAVKGETNDQALADELTRQFGALNDFTPHEKAFIANPGASARDRTQFSWRYEALNALLWAAGFVDELDRPQGIIDVPAVMKIFRENGRAGLLRKAKLRPLNEILDEADLIYRYHWAVREAENTGKPAPAGLDGGVIVERHHALNWLIGYMDQDWDEVTTDT